MPLKTNNLKRKAKEREDLGVNLFNLQEEVSLSQRQITSFNKTLAELDDKREGLEEELTKLRSVFKEETRRISDIVAQGMVNL